MRKSVLFLVGGLLLVANAFAEVKTDFSAYARSGYQIGRSGNAGEALDTGGFATHNRLHETQYFELGVTTQLPKDSRFVVTLASSDQGFHYTDNWDGSKPFVIRNLYFEFDKLPDAAGVSAWFGSRMYRGRDIYLFDRWMIDDQNILGAGLGFGEATHVEFALGVKKAASYSGPAFTNENGQRYILINKLEIPVTDSKKVKTNLEYHWLPKAKGMIGVNSVEAPAENGFLVGAHYDVIQNGTLFARYGKGDVTTGSFSTLPQPVAGIPGALSRKDSDLWAAGFSHGAEFERVGVLSAAIVEDYNKGRSGSLSVRPMYYLTDYFHLGVELDGVKYFKQLDPSTNVSYVMVSPMLEYALNKNVYGSPKLRLIASEAFYAKNVTKYGRSVKTAYNLGLGFEVWF